MAAPTDAPTYPAPFTAPGPDLGIERYRKAGPDHLGTRAHVAPGLVDIEVEDISSPQRVPMG
ncbi:hypothetical protein [Bradyrhizobium prioriisuperbiae]|uniref:hypothetical protein n=1 Tax=Bradyrhizobium prioriisuperbiae TaxID=2854389 RepID=UPI0028EB9B76|nr:hypothetical protein [Bradyrhizobium prioritasuperba]